MSFLPPTVEDPVMVLGSAQHDSDCPRDPRAEAGRRRERDQWLRRRFLQRQLHDGAALRISALTLHLGLLRHRSPPDERAVQDCIGELQDELHTVLEELREVTAKIYPPLLDEAGLGPALREVADQLQTPIAVVATGERFGPAAEGAAYFAVADCLAAPSGLAGARAVKVTVQREDHELVLSVAGIDACHAELIADRALPLGGSVDVAEGTDVVAGDRSVAGTITARFPCE
jgi:Histidine kinase